MARSGNCWKQPLESSSIGIAPSRPIDGTGDKSDKRGGGGPLPDVVLCLDTDSRKCRAPKRKSSCFPLDGLTDGRTARANLRYGTKSRCSLGGGGGRERSDDRLVYRPLVRCSAWLACWSAPSSSLVKFRRFLSTAERARARASRGTPQSISVADGGGRRKKEARGRAGGRSSQRANHFAGVVSW